MQENYYAIVTVILARRNKSRILTTSIFRTGSLWRMLFWTKAGRWMEEAEAKCYISTYTADNKLWAWWSRLPRRTPFSSEEATLRKFVWRNRRLRDFVHWGADGNGMLHFVLSWRLHPERRFEVRNLFPVQGCPPWCSQQWICFFDSSQGICEWWTKLDLSEQGSDPHSEELWGALHGRYCVVYKQCRHDEVATTLSDRIPCEGRPAMPEYLRRT